MTNTPNLYDPNELHAFAKTLASDLAAAGLFDASKRLNLVLETAYTTGSEWLGELGLAVRDIQRSNKPPAALNDRLKMIMKVINKTWRKL